MPANTQTFLAFFYFSGGSISSDTSDGGSGSEESAGGCGSGSTGPSDDSSTGKDELSGSLSG